MTVLYRVHGDNGFHSRAARGGGETPEYKVAKERFVNWLCDREKLDRVPHFRLVLAELASAPAWLPFAAAGIYPESALVMPWPFVKRLQVCLAMLRARLACRAMPPRGLRARVG